MIRLALIALLALAACGAEAPPERPEGGSDPSPGRIGGVSAGPTVAVSGSATLGYNR